jgi:hypothetical protein
MPPRFHCQRLFANPLRQTRETPPPGRPAPSSRADPLGPATDLEAQQAPLPERPRSGYDRILSRRD